VQQSVFQRVRKTVRVMVGAESMRRYPPHAPAVAD
jgi:hypothetical protein